MWSCRRLNLPCSVYFSQACGWTQLCSFCSSSAHCALRKWLICILMWEGRLLVARHCNFASSPLWPWHRRSLALLVLLHPRGSSIFFSSLPHFSPPFSSQPVLCISSQRNADMRAVSMETVFRRHQPLWCGVVYAPQTACLRETLESECAY